MTRARRNRPAAAALLTALCLAAASPASAQSAERRARAAFEEGNEALARSRFDEAVEMFSRSLGLLPRAATAWNLVVSLRSTGRHVEALSMLRRVDAGEFGDLARPLRDALPELRDELEGEIAHLEILGRGPGDLEVRVDGVEVLRGPGEQTVPVDPGEHRVTATARDASTVEQIVRVESGDRREVRLVVEANDDRPGRLVLTSGDAEATLEVVGVTEGPPPLDLELDAGEYEVAVRASSGRRTSTVTVPPGRTVRLSLEPPEGSSIWESPWLWTGVAVAVLGGVALALGLTLRVNEPVQVNPYGVIVIGD